MTCVSPGVALRQTLSPVDGEHIELGAEFLHGGDSTSKRVSDCLGLPSTRVFTAAHGDGGPDDQPAPDGGSALYHLRAQDLCLSWDSDDPGFRALGEALGNLSELSVAADDSRSLTDYLTDEGERSRVATHWCPDIMYSASANMCEEACPTVECRLHMT